MKKIFILHEFKDSFRERLRKKLQRGFFDINDQLVNFMLKYLNNELTVFFPYKKHESEIFKKNKRKRVDLELLEHASYQSKAFPNILGKGSLLQPLNSS